MGHTLGLGAGPWGSWSWSSIPKLPVEVSGRGESSRGMIPSEWSHEVNKCAQPGSSLVHGEEVMEM